MVSTPLRWDLFCRVVDNHGDLGVCWRLAADLAARGHTVRLWADDASALAWMAPDGQAGVSVHAFDAAAQAEPADVVVEAFGCDPPAAFVARMAARLVARSGTQDRPPVWINLEYLSAEAWVERSHGLPSPQLAGPGVGLTKWFFFPGFTAGTGGLIQEADLAARQAAFDGAAWLAAAGLTPLPGEHEAGERVVSLFCYADAPVPALLDLLGAQPTLLLAAAGTPSALVHAALGPGLRRGALRARLLPHLTQREFDHLLWACDLNFVRGEDSFVRAQFAGRPFVWQAYPQRDGAHAAKLAAFAARFMGSAELPGWWPFWQAWNGVDLPAQPQSQSPHPQPLPPLPALAPWRSHCEHWRLHWLEAGALRHDLSSALLHFVSERR